MKRRTSGGTVKVSWAEVVTRKRDLAWEQVSPPDLMLDFRLDALRSGCELLRDSRVCSVWLDIHFRHAHESL